MTTLLQNDYQLFLNQIADKIRAEIPEAEQELLIDFSQNYFSLAAYHDLSHQKFDCAYGQLLSHWKLVAKRTPRTSNVKVYNPTLAKDGWQSKYTIIQVAYDDMPFLVDSIRMEIHQFGLLTHAVINAGNIFVERDDNDMVVKVCSPQHPSQQAQKEAAIHFEIDRQTDTNILQQLTDGLVSILEDVRIVVQDWKVMIARMEESMMRLRSLPSQYFNAIEIEETHKFLAWLKNGNFTFLACRDYRFDAKSQAVNCLMGKSLGTFRGEKGFTIELSNFSEGIRQQILSSDILFFTKMASRSTVHRAAYADCISVKQFNSAGQLVGIRSFIGLYTSRAYNSSVCDIPLLSHKASEVIAASGFYPEGHSGKTLLNILESLPRDDFMQSNTEQLFSLAIEIMQLQDRQGIRLFMRKDSYERFCSCLVFVPKNKITEDLCQKIEKVFVEELSLYEISYELLLFDSMLASIHFVMRLNPTEGCSYDEKRLENKLIEIAYSWQDKLSSALRSNFDEDRALDLYDKYADAFPTSYCEIFSAESAIQDIAYMERLNDNNPLDLHFYDRNDDSRYLRLKVFRWQHTTTLSNALPILEHMKLRVIGERPHRVLFSNEDSIWINDFDMKYMEADDINLDKIQRQFQQAFTAIWSGAAENDAFNGLILKAQLSWKEVALLRAYAKYFRQIGVTFSDVYIANTLTSHPLVIRYLMELFYLRFDPTVQRSRDAINKVEQRIIESLDHIYSLDEDRILRLYLEVIKATKRVNFFQKEIFTKQKSYLAFKISPQEIQEMPLPKPMYEIYIYSPRFEGVHLRGAKVSRGGLRWSDRREDFRTEVLGLMKAQKVKNSCIAPLGAKGGFVTKNIANDASRDEMLAEGKTCYQCYIQALLDITDNFIDSKSIHPEDTVCYDGDDYYLVVAADKGTASFSDIANEIAIKNEFWLGDAFASGGSTGYNHKQMAITSRGVWESVKRHFMEMGRDCQNEEFTAIGIGDMAGDLFGNGVLLSKHFRLIAAFNHMHIFLDPNPDAATSYAERKRLFNLSYSTWEDYDENLISEGGGVFSRHKKAIEISPQIKEVLKVEKDFITPNELIRCILTAEVDLLWNGGIGTFVKAINETNLAVGDKGNDALRVDAKELNCKIVAEGGNLGFTQSARIEYELYGGRIYADFIDNSAGVNCSDHEVNIKILLDRAVRRGKLTPLQRNQLLTEMTEDVANLVIKDNYSQAQALSLAQTKADQNLDLYINYMNSLDKAGKIDLDLECLPTESALLDRKSNGKGLTRPELAVLFAYSKNILKEQILASSIPEDSYLSGMLRYEFPETISEQYEQEMKNHILGREIIATQLSNTLINDMGFTFIPRLQNETGASVVEIVRSFTIAQKVFGKRSLWHNIDKLDLKVATNIQFEMMRDANRLIRHATRWLLEHQWHRMEITKVLSHFAKPVAYLANRIDHWLEGDDKKFYQGQLKKLMNKGVDKKTAVRVASCLSMQAALGIVDAALTHHWPVEIVANTYSALGDKLGINWLRQTVAKLQPSDFWGALLRTNFYSDLAMQQSVLTIAVLKHDDSDTHVITKVKKWIHYHQKNLNNWQQLLAKLKTASEIDATKVNVLVRELLTLSNMKKVNNDTGHSRT